ncbi:MAG: hypothetical protein J3R72DRAFT_431954 [Linnemannia gamsii]|nr:MAG: hypothetical protein J3R72DRAFT_431954 [Linnemannia gamsii]
MCCMLLVLFYLPIGLTFSRGGRRRKKGVSPIPLRPASFPPFVCFLSCRLLCPSSFPKPPPSPSVLPSVPPPSFFYVNVKSTS